MINNSLWRRCGAVFTLWLWLGTSIAAPSALSWSEATALAWQRALAARHAEGQVALAAIERDAARRWWASPPALALAAKDDRWLSDRGSQEFGAAVIWPLWLPGQRDAEGEVAAAAQQDAEAAMQLARLTLAGQVLDAGETLTTASTDHELLQHHQQMLQQLQLDVSRRVSAGELPTTDLLAMDAELLSAQAAVISAQQGLQQAHRHWQLLVGSPLLPAFGAGLAPPPAGDNHLSQHPAMLLATASVALARAEYGRDRIATRDAPELTLGWTGEQADALAATDHSLALELRIPFGSADRNLPRQTQSAQRLLLAEAEQQQLAERLTAELASARDARAAAEQHYQLSSKRCGALQQRSGLVRRAFDAGEQPLADALRAETDAVSGCRQMMRDEALGQLSHARYHLALGQLP